MKRPAAAISTTGSGRRRVHWRLLLDQFPRNAFRGTSRMYASDASARRIADAAIAAGRDRDVENALRTFFYMPFAHSEARGAAVPGSGWICRIVIHFTEREAELSETGRPR
jgi:Bacterial protein of unknown function (DUF924)